MSEFTNNKASELALQIQFEQLSPETQAALLARSDETSQSLAASVGWDNLTNVDLWENIRVQVANTAYRNTRLLTSEHVPIEDDSVIESIYKSVSVDLFGSPDLGMYTGQDIADWRTGQKLLDECRAVEDLTTKESSGAMEATHMLCQYGIYKFAKWGNDSQLLIATELAKEITLKGSFNNIEELEYVENTLLLLEAACKLDDSSKPNYRYAKPERLHIRQTTHKALINLGAARMHVTTKHGSGSSTSA